MEKLNSNRIPEDLTVVFPLSNKIYTGTVTNLSGNGMLIDSEFNLPTKSRFELLISIYNEILKIPAIFVRREIEGNHNKGMVVKLLDPPKEYLDFVFDLHLDN